MHLRNLKTSSLPPPMALRRSQKPTPLESAPSRHYQAGSRTQAVPWLPISPAYSRELRLFLLLCAQSIPFSSPIRPSHGWCVSSSSCRMAEGLPENFPRVLEILGPNSTAKPFVPSRSSRASSSYRGVSSQGRCVRPHHLQPPIISLSLALRCASRRLARRFCDIAS